MFLLSVFVLVAVLLVGVAIFVRSAPFDPDLWHRPVPGSAPRDEAGGALRVISANHDTFAQLAQALAELPRTQLLAGNLEAAHMSFVTRSAVFGFPDVTTIEQRGDYIAIYARLRFGISDMGVNRKRIEALMEQIESHARP